MRMHLPVFKLSIALLFFEFHNNWLKFNNWLTILFRLRIYSLSRTIPAALPNNVPFSIQIPKHCYLGTMAHRRSMQYMPKRDRHIQRVE